AAAAGVCLRRQPVARADPPGLQQEPDQRAADRFVRADARRYQRGSGQQPGAVDPPVDRDVGTVAGQPVAAERSSAPALIPAILPRTRTAGVWARRFLLLRELLYRYARPPCAWSAI